MHFWKLNLELKLLLTFVSKVTAPRVPISRKKLKSLFEDDSVVLNKTTMV